LLSLGEWATTWSDTAHASAVRAVRGAIDRGEVYQVNIVGHRSVPYQGDPAAALRAVAALPGASYGGGLYGEGWAVATASPECLVTVSGGVVETRPIKGTRPASAAGRAELLADPKERAEHVMIVDLERNDLSRVAAVGSVSVPSLFSVRRWCGLWQAESVVRARLRTGVGLVELLRAVLPGGSVTGAPKLAALAQIAALEPVGRGPAMGAMGFFTAGRLDLGLTIRTLAADGSRLHLWAGGGITRGSDPGREVAEAHAKARPVLAAVASAAGQVRPSRS
jgi:para-aminobenzoate synthetase component I